MSPMNPQRRLFWQAGTGLLLAPWVSVLAATGRSWASGDPFSLGVASGDPAADGFVLWTRLAPEPLSPDPSAPGGMRGASVPVRYEIASDPQMRSVLRSGTVSAEAGLAYSVHVEVHGLLPDRHYWYRFASGDATSAIGHAITLPAVASRVQRLRLGFVSCANYEHGYFAAYRHLSAEQPDLVLFLGDYLYEYVDRRGNTVRTHSGGTAARTLPGYRNRYAQYRLDADLQRLHGQSTALITWDDHEVQNNYADAWSQDFVDPRLFLKRRAAAYQAFYEHMPVRPSRGLPDGPALRIFERYRFGDLAEIALIDGRQYRSAPACQTPANKGNWRFESNRSCPERLIEARSMLGARQEAWLLDGLKESRARWNLIAQDVQMAQTRKIMPEGENGFRSDSWDGYPAARSRLLHHLDRYRVSNPVVLSGDIHACCASDLTLDFDRPDSRVVATEFVGTSISSHGPGQHVSRALLAHNPHLRFHDGRQRGYTTVDITPRQMTTRYRVISDARDPQASVSTLKTLVVESGRPGIRGQT